MKNKFVKTLSTALALTMCVGMLAPVTVVRAEEVKGEWREEDGNSYWYENGVKQGLEGRGKEIYDPASDAWYWLDQVDGGKKAVSKDVYQESEAGPWGDYTDEAGVRCGKWVRYDENGHMVKGWNEKDGNRYFFDYTYGTMAKGYATIDGKEYYFNEETGVLERELGDVPEMGWKNIDGNDYWYEGHVRQGYSIDDAYRGKEIYDPASDAWYWLDNVDDGKKAVSKDVYQESLAGSWGDITGEDGQLYGKWVRYDEKGHMIKGWSEDGKYYFDPIYGTMAKGNANIDGKNYYFDENTGVLQYEISEEDKVSLRWYEKEYFVQNDDGTYSSRYVSEYNDDNKNIKQTGYIGSRWTETEDGRYVYSSDTKEDMLLSYEYTYEYNADGDRTKSIYRDYSSYEENGVGVAWLSSWSETTYNENGDTLKRVYYSSENRNEEPVLYSTDTYEYDEKGYLIKLTEDYADEDRSDRVTEYENDEKGKVLKMTQYSDGEKTYVTTYEYNADGYQTAYQTEYVAGGYITSRTEYDYDASGNRTEQRSFSNTWGNELRLTRRYVYTYNENGSRTSTNEYRIDDVDGKQVERQVAKTEITYLTREGYRYESTSTYDSYRGFYRYGDNGEVIYNSYDDENWDYEWAYSYGYEYKYDSETGRMLERYEYDADENYKKALDTRTEYHETAFPEGPSAGQTVELKDTTVYDKDGNRISYTTYIWEARRR